jgi:hypothetical protein
MMKIYSWLFISLMVVSLCSCGVISKAKYGNGLKLNLELNLGRDKSKAKTNLLEQSRRDYKKFAAEYNKENQGPHQSFANADSVLNKQIILDEEIMTFTIREHHKIKKIKKKAADIPIDPEIGKATKTGGRELETYTACAGIMFYGSIMWFIIAAALGITIGSFLITILSISIAIGFLLAIIGRQVIRKNNYTQSGRWLASSIIVLSSLFGIIGMLLMVLLIASFA